MNRSSNLVAVVLVNLMICTLASAFIRRGFPMNAPAGMTNLPYTVSDSAGTQWMVYNGGWFRQNGQQPLYQQGATLTVNGNAPQMNNNQANVDAKTGELVMEDMPTGPVTVTRRILIDPNEATARYIDIFKNPTAQPITVNVLITTNCNWGLNSANTVMDPKHKDRAIGWVGVTPVGKVMVEMYCGKNSKLPVNVQYQQGNNMVAASYSLDIPANKSVAIMHLHATAATADAGTNFIQDLKESKLLHALTQEERKLLLNFVNVSNFIGDMEILRGDMFDVVELRTGDQLKGTIKDPNYKLTTSYGEIVLPTEQVVAILNVGQFRPRQLLVTADGQMFGGKLTKETLTVELSSGQVIEVPLSQIGRAGYRKRAGEPEEWTFEKPFVLLRTGDRVNLQMPSDPIAVHTRYGDMKIDPASLASIVFQSEDNGVHEIYLVDGSHFSGLVAADQFDMKLASGDTAVKFPTSSIMRLQLTPKVADEDDATTPILTLANNDVLVGTLSGSMKLDTAFNTIQLKGEEIKHMVHTQPGSTDVQVTTWDNTTVSGQMQESDMQCKLLSGASVTVSMPLVAEYNQPQPRPSSTIIDQIKQTVLQLSADDWKTRDQAEATLIKLGPSVISVLKDMRDSQPPEAQQRIDSVVKQLQKQNEKPPAAPAGPPNPPDAMNGFQGPLSYQPNLVCATQVMVGFVPQQQLQQQVLRDPDWSH